MGVIYIHLGVIYSYVGIIYMHVGVIIGARWVSYEREAKKKEKKE